MRDFEKIGLDSQNAALKAIGRGSGSITAPLATSANSPQANTVTIPHNQNSSNVFPAVIINASSVYGSTRYITLPWSTPDGRTSAGAHVDATNIYITATSFTAGADQPALSFTYTYSILVP